MNLPLWFAEFLGMDSAEPGALPVRLSNLLKLSFVLKCLPSRSYHVQLTAMCPGVTVFRHRHWWQLIIASRHTLSVYGSNATFARLVRRHDLA